MKLGKVVDDATFGRILQLINKHRTLGDFYADNASTAEAIGELQKSGVISGVQLSEMFDGDSISAIGKDMLENMLIGKAFEINPDTVRQASELKSMRQCIVTALAEISNNLHLGDDYKLERELSEAISLVYQARKNGGYKAGEKVSDYARQMNLFPYEEGETIADYRNAVVMTIADIINDSRVTLLKKYLQIYNNRAKDYASGQLDIFADGLLGKDEILNEVKTYASSG